jgi:alanyl-tRNA synthetase
MTFPSHDTIVNYPSGATDSSSTVVHLEPLPDGRTAVFLDETCFHPVDASWPDQGADRGAIRAGETALPIVDAVVAATDGSSIHLGSDVPVRRGEEGWTFLVGHIVEDAAGLSEGMTVEVVVDGEHRRALSIGHTACHLASLALNAALAGRWSKEARTDGLGHPDFDGLAIDSSRITEFGSVDRFRLNKSLRRKGFATDGLADELSDVEADANTLLAEWIVAGSDVSIEREGGDGLTDLRWWTCDCAGETVRIACGGTHARSLAELGSAGIALSIADEDGTPVMTMVTTASPS